MTLSPVRLSRNLRMYQRTLSSRKKGFLCAGDSARHRSPKASKNSRKLQQILFLQNNKCTEIGGGETNCATSTLVDGGANHIGMKRLFDWYHGLRVPSTSSIRSARELQIDSPLARESSALSEEAYCAKVKRRILQYPTRRQDLVLFVQMLTDSCRAEFKGKRQQVRRHTKVSEAPQDTGEDSGCETLTSPSELTIQLLRDVYELFLILDVAGRGSLRYNAIAQLEVQLTDRSTAFQTEAIERSVFHVPPMLMERMIDFGDVVRYLFPTYYASTTLLSQVINQNTISGCTNVEHVSYPVTFCEKGLNSEHASSTDAQKVKEFSNQKKVKGNPGNVTVNQLLMAFINDYHRNPRYIHTCLWGGLNGERSSIRALDDYFDHLSLQPGGVNATNIMEGRYFVRSQRARDQVKWSSESDKKSEMHHSAEDAEVILSFYGADGMGQLSREKFFNLCHSSYIQNNERCDAKRENESSYSPDKKTCCVFDGSNQNKSQNPSIMVRCGRQKKQFVIRDIPSVSVEKISLPSIMSAEVKAQDEKRRKKLMEVIRH